MKRSIFTKIALILFAIFTFAACSSDNEIIAPPHTIEDLEGEVIDGVEGFFLLNEGQMYANNSSLDFFSYKRNWYTKNIFEQRNAEVEKGLGDIGNDIQIYNDRIYVVMNGSHYIEVLDLKSAKHLGAISVASPRYIAFEGDYAYVTSYRGPDNPFDDELVKDDYTLGIVSKIDLKAMKVVKECNVGYYPEGISVVGDKLLVANSGFELSVLNENRVSVIDIATFKVTKSIEVGANIQRFFSGAKDELYLTTMAWPYHLTILDAKALDVKGTIEQPVSNMAYHDNLLYIYSSQWSPEGTIVDFMLYDAKKDELVEGGFIKDGTEGDIKSPYGIAVHPSGNYIYIADSGTFTTPGNIHCYSAAGKRLWAVTAGVGPSKMVFTKQRLTGM